MSHGFLWMGGVVDRVSEVLDDIGAAARRALKPAGSAEQ
jgi:hypothetical protein